MRDMVATPPTSVEITAWLASLSTDEVAYIHGATFVLIAKAMNMTEADLYAEFARRAARDPDCQVVRT